MHRINLIRSGRDRPKTFPTRRPFGCPKPSSRLYDGTQRSTPELRLGPHRQGCPATPGWQHTTPTLRPGLLSESPVTGSESGRVLRRATARLRLGPPPGARTGPSRPVALRARGRLLQLSGCATDLASQDPRIETRLPHTPSVQRRATEPSRSGLSKERRCRPADRTSSGHCANLQRRRHRGAVPKDAERRRT